ncbi:hypothetical protein N658DRAFT_497847 [Parathielavia hyrcaniae]|uniref:Uncharacterized protein n=1 Tax=Parathielavia hyrcaniae TaxID=113614 RepID=A0AAN6T0T0_9PEZI|nr:hypothetical protein N658DRAFT_497847 [Parathielavia hyrcaniae]
MAGGFPGSDDDDEAVADDEEEEIGPLDMPRAAARDKAQAGLSGSRSAAGEKKTADNSKTGGGGGSGCSRCACGGALRRDGADAEWGVD